MNITVSSLSAALLAFAWESEPNTAYTLQTSRDLSTWSTIPAIFSGTGDVISYAVTPEKRPIFARIRSSNENDTNLNGLPDTWEWHTFGYIDVPPEGDPDMDGQSNLMEWLAQTDPLDAHNGTGQLIYSRSDKEWFVPLGTISAEHTQLRLTDSRGNGIPGATISAYLKSGKAALVPADQSESEPQSAWELTTDFMGNINAANGLRLRNDNIPTGSDTLVLETNSIRSEITIYFDPSTTESLPRELRWKRLPRYKTELSWSGELAGVNEIIIERFDPLYGWQTASRISPNDFPESNPENNRFTLVLDNLQ